MTLVSRYLLTALVGVLAGMPVATAQNQSSVYIAYDGDATAKNHASTNLSVTVTDTHNKPAVGAHLTFKLGSQSCSAVIDKAGKGACIVIVNQPAGKYTVDVDVRGDCVDPCDNLYAGGSSTTVDFAVTKEKTKSKNPSKQQ